MNEAQVRDYLLHLKNDRKFASSSLGIAYSAIKFFYSHTAPRDWPTLQRIRVQKEKRLPDVLSIDEVRQLIGAVRKLRYRTYFSTVYSLGLRRNEGLHLQVRDIDSARMLVHVHRGKGAKDRFVPLPARTLTLLREYWVTHRNPVWLFPANGSDHARLCHPTAPCRRTAYSMRCSGWCTSWAAQGGVDPHVAAQLRHPSSGGGRQPAVDPAVPGPQLAANDDGLPPSHHRQPGAGDRRDQQADGTIAHADRRRRAAAVRRSNISSGSAPPCPGSTRRCCTRSPRAAPANLGPCSTPANPAGRSTRSADRAATGIARPASTIRPKAWLEKQTDRLLPCPYFLVTFTLPAELRHWPEAISA